MDLLTSFKNYLFSQEVQPSKVTVKNYLSDINHFVNWFSQKYNSNFTPGQVNFQTLEEYKKDNSSVFSASSMQRHLSSLRKFFKFLKIENQITFDPFEALALNKPEEKDYWKLKDFKSSLFDTNAAHLTIKNYIIDVKQFINWAKEATGLEDSILPGRISKEFIEEYKTALSSSKGFSPASVNRKLSSLRKYLTWADEAGILTEKVLDFTNINEAKQKLFIPETPEFSQPEIKTKTYSRFPPLRLAQKLSQGLILALDAALILPLASFAKKGQDLAWTLKGKPIFHKNPQTFQIKNITHKDLLGIRNISKKVFAPSTIAVSSLSPLQRIIFHARFTRPNWYKRYHSYAITHYFHFAVFIIVIVAISLGFYNSFFGNQSKITAAPNLPTSPNRILSFQGRLTDNNDNPITSLTNLRFAIYTQQTPGTGAGILLWQEVDKVTPDQDGIFNTLLGSGPTCANPIAIATGQCAIPSTLFAENAALFLGVTVESTGELTPRQQIATVGYAANSETLQGLLPITATAAGTSNVVLALDSSGNLTIGGSASPAFSASGGQFKLSGQPLLLTTNDSSNSNVVISPNGTGKIDVQKPLQNNTLSTNIRSAAGAFTAAGAVEVNDQFAILATSSGQSAFTVNQNSTGPVISASVSGVPVFTVDNGGNISNSGNYSVSGTSGITLLGTGSGITFSGSGNHDITASSGTLRLGSTTLNGTLTTSFTGNNRVLYADSATGALSAVTGSSGLCLVSGATTPTWGSCASGLPTDWWTTSSDGKALTPINSTMDFLLGGTATSTAKFAVLGLNGTGPATATVAGNLIVMPKNGAGGNVGIGTTSPLARLQVNSTGDGTLFRLQRAGGSNLPIFQYNFTEATNIIEQEITGASAPTLTWKLGGSEQMRITPNGRLGIGTTSPTAILDVDGAASVGGQFTFRNGTAQIQSTANQQLTIGGNTTGNIILSPLNNSGYVGIGTTTPISLLSAFRDITDVANIGRSTTQNVGIGGTAGGNFLTSYSATNNAKSLIINATTDSSNTAPSAGTNGIVFQIRGGTSFAIDDNGDSRFYNDVTIDDTLTVGSTASIAGNLTLSGGARSIQTTTNNNLTLGGNTTGNIWLMPRNGAGTVYGDTAANGNLTLEGTSHATKTTSYLLLQPNGGNVGIGDSTPSKLFVVGNGDLFQVDSNGNALAPTLALGNGTIARTDRLFDINDSNSDINAKTYTGTVQRTITGTINANRTDYGLYNYVTTTASDDMFSHTAIAGYNVSQLNNGYTIDTSYGTQGYSLISSSTLSSFGNTATTSAGTYGIANLNAAGTVTSNMGIYGIAQNSNAGGTVTNNDGGRFISYATTDGATITTSRGIYAQSYENGDYASNGIVTGYGGYFDSQDADTTYGIWARGLQSSGLSETFTNTYGIWSQCQAASAGTTITNCYGITSLISASNATATITNAYGIHIQNPTSTGTIVNNHGLYIQDQTGGDTNDYGITIAGADTQVLWLSSGADNTDAANGIAFGASRDTNLYRSAADTLKTDDKLAIGTLNSGASNPLCYDGSNILSTCAAGALGTNWWTTSTDGKALTPINNTMDLLVGGNSTSSAQFAVLNIAGTLTPIASVSATAGSDATKGIYLSGNGSLQSVRNNTLTIGGDTTGNILLKPLNNISGGNVGIGTTSPIARVHSAAASSNPTNGIGSFSYVASGAFGGGIGFQDGTGNFGIWVDTTGTIARFGFGTSLGSLTSYMSLTNAGALTIADDLRVNGNDILDSAGTSRITLGATTTLTNTTTTLSGTSTLTASSLANITSAAAVSWGTLTSLTFTADNATIYGSDAANGNLTLEGTSNGTKTTSYVNLQPSGGNVGIGTTAPDRALEINSATGNNLRLTYNDSNGSATNYADLVTNSGGDLSINPSGGDLITSGAFTSQNGNIYAGVNDTTGGLFHAYGNGTGSSEGGEIILYTAADYDTTVNAYNLDAYQDDFRIYQGSNTRLTITNTGLVGLGVGNTVPTSQLYVSRPLASGATGKALSIFDQIENQDIFTASASGTPVFTITRAGGISLGSNGLNYGTGSQCIAGGATASWVNCALGTNWWTTSTDGKALTPINNTMDLLVGGNSTSSAQFAVLNIAGTLTPIASVSATAGSDATKGIYLSGNGSLQSVRNNTLTIGGDTTGNINLSPSNGSGFVNISGGLGASGIIAGKNILPYQYASWETGVDGTNIPSARNVNVTSVTISTADAYDGTRSVAVTTNGSATDGYAYLNGTSSTSYNIPIKPSTKYAFSVYSKLSAGTTCSVEMYIRESDGTHRSAGGTADTSSWTRLSNTFTSNSGSTAVIIRVDANCASTTALFDGFMLEEIPTSQTYASAWSSNGNFGIRMDQNNLLGLDGSASVSGNLVLEGASRSIQSYNQETLTIGGNSTGNITLSPNNGTGGLINNNGYIAANGNTTITGSPLSAGTNLGWKVGLWSNSFALGIANSTLAVKTGTWLSIFGSSNPANNATSSTPDTNSNINFNATTGDASISGSLVFQSASTQTIDILNGSRLDFQVSPGGDAGLTNAMTILSNGNVGIGTTAPISKFTIGNNIAHDASYDYSGAQQTIFDPNDNGGDTPNGTSDILNLVREGISGQSYGNKATFALGRYEDVGTNSRTQLDIKLTDGSFNSHNTILSLQSAGNVGIGDTSPDAKLEVLSTSEQLRLTYADGTADSRFTVDSSGNLTIDNTGTKTVVADDLQVTGNDVLDSAGTSRITLGATTTLTNTTTTLSGTSTLTASSLNSIDAAASLAIDSTTLTLGGGAAATIATTTNGLTLDSGSNTLTFAATDTTLTTSLTSMTTGAAFTLNGTSYVRVGDTATPGSATGDDDLFVEGDLEVDGVLYTDGGIDTALTPGSVVFAGTSGVLSQDNASLFYDDTNDSLGIGTAAPGSTTRLSVAKTWGSATAGEQFGIYSNINYSAADTGLKQNLRLNTGATHTTGTQANLIGLLSLVSGAGNGGTTTNAYGLWSRIDSATGHTVTNGINYGINNGTVTGTLTNQMGIQIAALTTGTNNAGILIGEATGTNQSNLVIGSTSIPTGTYSIYNSSTDQNYFAGDTGIGTTAPERALEINSATGANLRLTYNDSNGSATNYADLTTNSGGDLTVHPSGGQVILDNTGDSSLATALSGVLILGNSAGDNITMDGNEIMARTAGTTASTLFLNAEGGLVSVGAGGLTSTGTLTANGTLDANGIFTLGDGGETGAITTSDWAIDTTGNITNIGNITNTANSTLPHIALDSISTGDNWTDQGAYISLGESGALGSASMHITYTGDGYGYTGAGTVTSGIPAGGYWRYRYDSQQIYTPSSVDVTNNITLTQPTATTNTLYGLKNSVGTDKGWFGIIGTAGAYITGSSQYDVFVRSQQNLFLAANTAGNADLTIESTSGDVGLGDTSPDAKLEVLSTTEQLRLTYADGTVDSRFTVDSSGNLTIDNTGTKTVVADDLQVTGNDILDSAGTSRITLGATTTLTNTGLTFSGTTGITASSLTSMTTGAAFTLNGTSYVRVGDTATPGSATGDDDLFVEGDLEVDGVLYTDGGIDTALTPGSVVFAGTSGVLSQDNANLFWDDSANKLGIGDSSPANLLSVSTAGHTTDGFIDVTSGGSIERLRLGYGYNVGIEDNVNPAQVITDGSGNLLLSSRTNNASGLMFYTNAGTDGLERMRIDSSGKLGLGTASPISELQVTRALSTGATGKALAIFDQIENQDIFTASKSGVNKFVIDANGQVGIGTTLPDVGIDVEKATGNTFGKFGSTLALYAVANNPTLGFNAYYNSGWKFGKGSTAHYGGAIDINPATGNMNFQSTTTSGAADGAATMQTLMTILQTGNIGVGTTAPDRALEINSATGANLRLTYNDSNGSATNYADLTTNSGGDLTINPSGGDISLTSDRINFNTTGVAAPTFTNYSSGVKIVLYNDLSGSAAGYTLGIESGTMFSTVSTTGQQFKWYGGTTTAMTLTGAGALTLVGNLAVNGDTITTDGSLTLTPTTTLNLNSTGDMTLNSSGDIILDADGADVFFKDNGTTYATITNGTTNTTFVPLSDGLYVNGNLSAGITPSTNYRTYFYNQGTDATSKSTSRVLLQNICTSVACSGQYMALDAAAENHANSTQNTTGSLVAIGGTIGNSDTGTVTTARGLQISLGGNSGTITNTYGLYVGDLTTGTQTNTPYSIYSSDAGTYNYFAGKVGIGATAPGASFEINTAGSGSYLGSPSLAVIHTADDTPWGLVFRNDTAGVNKDTGLYLADDGTFAIYTGDGAGSSNYGVAIDTAGNTGIGTLSPKAKLDVAGSASLSGNLAYSGGTKNFSNYVLNGSKLNFMVSPGGTEGNGDIGDGFSTANQGQLPQALSLTSGSITSASVNGTTYIYSLGGQNSGGTTLSTVYKSRVDATFGNAGTFSSTANALPGTRWGGGATTVTIGSSTYIYLIGGTNASVQSTVYYATLSNSDGNPGTFATTSPLLGTRTEPAVTTATVGGTTYIYAMGGFNSNGVNTNPTSTVYKATVNSNGTLGTFSTTSPLLANRGGGGAVTATVGSSTYVYYVGGGDSQGRSTVYKAAVNTSNGTLGTFSSVTGLPINRQEGGTETITINGKTYIYSIGSGDNSVSTFRSDVYKTTLDSSGNPGTWSSSGQAQLSRDMAYIGTTLVTVNGNSYIFAVGGVNSATLAQSTVYRAGISNVAATIANNGFVGIGTSNPAAQLTINSNIDASLTSPGALLIGDLGGTNLALDNNEIQARENGAASTLYIQHDGGNAFFDGGGTFSVLDSTLQIKTTGSTAWNLNQGGNCTSGAAKFCFSYGSSGVVAIGVNGGTILGGSLTQNNTPDIAENINVLDTSIEAGDIVSSVIYDSTQESVYDKAIASKADKPYSTNIIGTISEDPGILLNAQLSENLGTTTNNKARPLTIAGRVPVKVSSINGKVKAGDPITSSEIPGIGMKATRAGNILGTALTDFEEDLATQSAILNNDEWHIEDRVCEIDESNCYPYQKVLVLINMSYFDPATQLAGIEELILQNQTPNLDFTIPHDYKLADIFGKPIENIGAFAELIAAKITAGFIKAEQISTKSLSIATANVSIAGQSLHDYIAAIVSEQISNISNLTSNNLVSPIAQIDEIHTNVISPVGQTKKVAIKLNDNQGESKLEIQNASGSALASFDSQGNASISGNLSSNNLLVDSNATVSGVLRASKIIADEIEGLNIKTSTIAANYITNNYYVATPGAFPTLPANNSNNNAYQMAGDYINIASYSSQLARISNLTGDDAIFNNTLTVFGQTTLTDTSIVGQLAVGGNLIIADEAINVLGGDLNLQPLRQGGLSIMAGLIHIDTNGNATFENNATIKGTLYVNQIAPLPGKDLNIKLASSSADTNSLVVKGASGAGVLAINNLGDLIASGEASFAKLNINSIVGTAYALSPTEVVASGSAGTVTLKALKTEVTVNNKLVTPNSLIYITPLGSTASENIYLMRQVPGKSFTVGISNPISQDVKFNFLIVN